MMTIPIFIGIAAVIFVIGVFFVVRGISAENQSAVPISDPEELQQLKNNFISPEAPRREILVQTRKLAEAQAEPAQEPIEGHQLRKELGDQRQKFEQLEREMEALKGKYAQMQDQKERERELLERERAKLDGEKMMLSSKSDLLSELKVKTEMLEKQYEEAQKRHAEMTREITQLKVENDHLVMQTKLKEEQAAIHLKEQKAEASKIEFEALSAKLIESIATIEGLKRENNDLKQSLEDLKEAFKKTGELNDHLLKKEKMLQYELTKNRAQALGLEKICEDFRAQIETMAETASRQ
ncbi:MAG TPA: hypothetical protein PKV41_04365 [Candidatus Omnitrophota bacterium]|nr:hypothetical protein [Candidatus Omnitrophota bacterium]